MANVFEEAMSSIGAAIADVREKVVEEGYFGRVVTGGEGSPGQAEAAPAGGGNVFEQALGSKLSEMEVLDKPRETPEPGSGMDL
jgi:hypothetical protein